MSATILIALIAGLAWGLNMVAVRWAIDATRSASEAGALVSVAAAAVVALAGALVAGDHDGLGWSTVWRFALVGAIAPGASQALFLTSIGTIGPARTGVFIGTSPAFAVVGAIVFLDEPWVAAIVIGTSLTVAGGVLLSWERTASGLLTLGAVWAVATAASFGARDVVARSFTTDTDLAVPWAATIVLASGAATLAAIGATRLGRDLLAATRGALPHFLVSGALVGVALPLLLWALSRGEVGVVAPLANAAQVLSVVGLSSLAYGRTERSRRVLVSVTLVLAGGTLIGVSR